MKIKGVKEKEEMNDYVLQPGDRIDNCVIKKPIGKGGYAEVYLVECKGLNEVALKLYTNPELDYKDLFLEIIAMGIFSNLPYFVKFYGAKPSRQFPHILMEYMRGGDLKGRMRELQQSNHEETLRIIYTICLALGDMHAMEVYHRDVSPENIFFNENGQAKLGDMGCALTQQNLQRFVLKIPYIAPEILEGGKYSEKSDIYSLGAVFYEMFGGDPRRTRPHEGIESLGVPIYLKEILVKMCNHDPEGRSSACELAKELAYRIGFSGTTVFSTPYESDKKEKPGWERLKEMLSRTDFFEEERVKCFRKGWMEIEGAVLKGFQDGFREKLYRSFVLSLTANQQKLSNCFLGLEHVLWVCLEDRGLLAGALSRLNISSEEMRADIFRYCNRIQFFPSKNIITKRLEAILNESRKSFPEGVGEKEFILMLLQKETFFSYLLREKGVDLEKVKKEIER